MSKSQIHQKKISMIYSGKAIEPYLIILFKLKTKAIQRKSKAHKKEKKSQ